MANELSGAELFMGGFGLLVGVVVGSVLAIPILLLISKPLSFPVAGLLIFVVSSTSARLFAARSDDLMAAIGLRSRGPLVSRTIDDGERSYLIDSSAADRLGEELGIEITSTTRTSIGRMLFGRVAA